MEQLEATSGGRIPERLGETLTQLAHVTNELSTATSVDAVTKIVTQHMADAVGATISVLALREGEEHVRLVGIRGLEAPEAEEWELFPLDRPNAISDAVRDGQRIVLVGAEEIARRYPELHNTRRGERTTVTVPLRVGGRTIGAIHLSVPSAVVPHPTELEFIDILADTCAQAFERIDALARVEEQTDRLAFLAEASIQLSSSLDLRLTTSRVARLAVPTYADWCAIDVVRDGMLHRIAAAHVDPDKAELALRVPERRPDGSEGTGAQVLRTGQPVLIPEITEEMLVRSTSDPAQAELVRELGLRSVLAVPLLVRGRVSGVLTWVSSDPGRRYDEDDVRFAEHLARRAASALDNAELFSQTRAVAEQLQRAVLPGRLASTADWEVLGHYAPSGRTDVGGDFYDAFDLGDRRYVAFVGDVMGRGVAAAAAMAQIRSAVRAFASDDPDPAAVVERLDRMVQRFDTDQLVTLAYVLGDASENALTLVNAGHVPPWLVRGDGHVDRLPFAEGPPLGLADHRERRRVTIDPGDTLLVVTDGLVERRHEDLEAGLARVEGALRGFSLRPLDAGLDDLVVALADDRSDDDVAALVLRRLATT